MQTSIQTAAIQIKYNNDKSNRHLLAIVHVNHIGQSAKNSRLKEHKVPEDDIFVCRTRIRYEDNLRCPLPS